MKAISLDAPLQFRMAEMEEPPKPKEGEALVRVHRVGICGTDISGYLGKMPFFSYPRIPGHELGVEVLERGAGVTNVACGDLCSIEPYINCQTCYACNRGYTNACMKHQTLGVHCDGGLRPRFLIPARKLHISRKLSLEQLALVETLAIGCHAVDRAALQAHETCAIIGAGPIGLSVLEFAKLTRARILMVDINPARLEFCRKVMGASETIVSSPKLAEDLHAQTEGKMPDVVFDATGSVQSMSNGFSHITHGGRLVFVGITMEEVHFRHAVFHKCEGTLLCSRNARSADFTRIIKLIEDGEIDTGPWITHRTRFEDLINVFPTFARPETGVIKAMVEIGE